LQVGGLSGYSGASGTSGYSGASGTSGYSGASGFSGFSGTSGFSGYSGVSGRRGVPNPTLGPWAYVASSLTTATGTGAGTWIGNNSVIGSITQLSISNTDFNGHDVSALLASSFTIDSYIMIPGRTSLIWSTFQVTGITTTPTYVVINVNFLNSNGSAISYTDGEISEISGGVSPGYSGMSGYSGKSGFSGFSGTSGFSGFSGVSPAQPTFAALATGTQTITATTMTDITGMSIALTAGTWLVEAVINGQSSATTGAQACLNYTGTVTTVDYQQVASGSTTANVATGRVTAINTASTTFHTTAAAEGSCRFNGYIVASSSGNLVCRGLKITSGNYIVRNGSFLRATKVA
jgi:hypothetical protein